jgi:hypothetical protein
MSQYELIKLKWKLCKLTSFDVCSCAPVGSRGNVVLEVECRRNDDKCNEGEAN